MSTEPFPIDINRLVPDALSAILRLQQPEAFQQWMREHMHEYVDGADPMAQGSLLGDEVGPSPEELRSIAAIFAHVLWNATPLPSNDFRPSPLPRPGRNEPCPCGSGAKFKHCCLPVWEQLPSFTSEHIWPALMLVADRKMLEAAVRAGALPVDQLVEMAQEEKNQGHPKAAQKLLEPLFDPEPGGTGEEYDYALNTLLDIYDELGYRQKKRKLLNRVLEQAGPSPLRSGAWQRLAAILMDEGDAKGAWDALEKARRDTPDDPYVGVLEIQLLLSEQRPREAAERARFWHRRLRKRKRPEEQEIREFFEQVAKDPQQALMEVASGLTQGLDLRLERWIQAVQKRPATPYEIECVQATEEESRICLLQPPKALVDLRREWQERSPLEPGVLSGPLDIDIGFGDYPWDPGTDQKWLSWLDSHPAAWDCIEILDNLADIIEEHPQGGSPWIDAKLLAPVLERSLAILQASIQKRGETPLLRWPALENRPALRNLGRLLTLEEKRKNLEKAIELGQLLLQLDPNDHQGYRAVLMRLLLQTDRNEEALELVDRYPDDLHLELNFGKVLALYRMGREKAARQALERAHELFPKALSMLRRKRVRKPDDVMPDGSFRLGGEDQAWLYRQENRFLWEQTPGALDWLKRYRPATK